MEARNLAAVGLSLMLAANCFMPCYTLAYADEPQGVPDVFEEEQKEVSDDANRLELSPGSGESISYGSDGDPAADGHGGDLEASEGSGQDIAPDNEGLDGAVVYDTELSADYPLVEEGDGGIDESFSGFGGDDSVSVDYGISPQAVIGGSIVDALIVSSISGDFTDFSYGSAKWKTNRGTLFWLLSYLLVNMQNALIRIENYSKAIDTSGKSTASDMSAAAGRLSGLLDRGNVTNERLLSIVNNTGDAAGRISGLLDRGNTTNAHLADIVDNTYNTAGRISGLLDRGNVTNDHLAAIELHTSDTKGRISGLLDRGNVTNDHLSNISTYTHDTAGRISGLLDRGNETNGYLSSVYGVLDAVTKGPEGGRVSFYSIGNAVEVIKNETRDLDNLLESIDGRVSALDALGVRLANIALTTDEIKKGVNSSLQWYETLHGDLSMLRHGAADLLPGYADWTVWDFLQGIYFDMGNVVDLLKGLQQTLTAWGDRWDSQDLYLMEWAKRWDALDKGGTWSESDKGALFAKLDGISDRLSVEAGQTVLDALLGEVKPQYINDQLTIVKEVARNRFPFCIPAMMQQMLGLMQSEAQVPHWEFDFFGSPLVLDLGDLESFALVTRWASCFMLFLALLANTKRFIFDLGGGGK
ncbi:hypothetical protein [uncultured Adlercreutzia sp.]|uniref:hypothetical protein n=1 Tax=uncultured Adlercreutzia sp. TaxID=875803 RepID=UPI002664EBE1|nr:hypothetical protein [uncultured Adlercreutzia sp.]